MRALLAAGIVLLFLAASTATANHPQNESGRNIMFDHKTGNEWWVEVILGGSDAAAVTAVHARDTDGPWTALEKKSWGAWGASFHIEPGHEVRFRASWSDGTRVESCWFTHPQGEEKCATPMPPTDGDWTRGTIAMIPEGATDLSIGDADRDGTPELYAAGPEGLYRIRSIQDTSSPTDRIDTGHWRFLAVGDGDNDGSQEIYATRFRDGDFESQLHRLSYRDGTWHDQPLAAGNTMSGPLTLGDLDHDGRRELYVSGSSGDGATLTQVSFQDGAWTTRMVANFSAFSDSGTFPQSVWIGDADADGTSELVMTVSTRATGSIWIISHDNGQWQTRHVADIGGLEGAVAGDVDGDGRGEIAAVTSSGDVYVIQHTGTTWTQTAVAKLPFGPRDIFLADGDNDGESELYVPSDDMHTYQVCKTDASWMTIDMGMAPAGDDFTQSIVVGDAQGDGTREVYVTTVDAQTREGHVSRFEFHPRTFDATFSGVRGNEWWVQVFVSSPDASIAQVNVRLNGGEWKPLTKQSWGAWTASYHIVQGTQVQFQARSASGDTDLSACYAWIPARGQDAKQTPCGAPSAFDASFSNVKGNDWWVEVTVHANEPLAGVDARLDCSGDWIPLTLRSWGSWARSFYVEPGTHVDFRARSTSGAHDISDNAYVWPHATKTDSCAAQ